VVSFEQLVSENVQNILSGEIMKKRKIDKKNIYREVKSIILTALIFIFITSAFIEGSIVPTPSMENTILTGDRLFINKFIFGAATPRNIPFTNIELPYVQMPSIREPKRNEIIVFRFPGKQNQLVDDEVEYWVKRCVALPGDTLEIRNKVIFVNGTQSPIPADVNYLNRTIKAEGIRNNQIFPANTNWNEDNYGPLIIPKKGEVVKLNINNIDEWRSLINKELRKFAVYVKENEIYIDGQVTDQYTIKEDYYFMVGDNRDNSLDSRFWGFVPRENIVGTPIVIFWSWDSDIPFTRPLDLLSSIRFNRIAKLVK
jgi:signal peptidase I